MKLKNNFSAKASNDVISETKAVGDVLEIGHQNQKHNDKDIWFDDCLIKVQLSVEKQK